MWEEFEVLSLFSSRRIMRGFFCFYSTRTHIHRIPVTQVVWDYVPSLLPWQPAWACSVRLERAALWCWISWVEGADVCTLSPVNSLLIPLPVSRTCRAGGVWCFKRMNDTNACFNSLYQPHLSANSSEKKTSAIFWKYDYRIWGRNLKTILLCPGLDWPLCSKLDWINDMLLFIMLPNTLKSGL